MPDFVQVLRLVQPDNWRPSCAPEGQMLAPRRSGVMVAIICHACSEDGEAIFLCQYRDEGDAFAYFLRSELDLPEEGKSS